MQAMRAASRAEFVQLQPARVVALILGSGVIALFALGTRQIYDNPVGFLCHIALLW
jgi:hypothetical protein